MALKDLKVLPGLFTLATDRGALARWKDGAWVRFWRGMPEKIGGYIKQSTSTFLGKARGVIDWKTLGLTRYIGFGTHLKLYVYTGGTFYDITPIRETQNPLGNNPFSMTNNSAVVTVTDTTHGALNGDYVTFSGAAAGGGITISGEYALTYVDANSYTITHSAVATSTTTGGGAAVVGAYQINVGAASTIVGYGFGAGAWGDSTWGTARTITAALDMARTWSMGAWGEDLIACPRGGSIYVWDASVGTGTRATIITNAPATAKAVFVSEEDRHIVALGAYDNVAAANDPMLIRWCDAEDYTTWVAASTNDAGRKRLDGGNEILCRVKTKGQDLIFTDTNLWSMTFDGPPYTYGFNPLGPNGGMRGPNAAKEFDGRTFWMGQKDFFVYDGVIRVLPCDVLNHVMDDINLDQGALIFAGANRAFGEVWWLYPSEDATECDKFVLYNAYENHWSFGDLARTVYVGDSDLFSGSYALGADGYIYDHETGVNADTSAITSYLESGDIEIAEGEQQLLISKLVPDFKRLTGTVSLILKGRKYPASGQITSDTESITSSTTFVNPRMKCRQVALYLSVSAVGADYRMGTLRVDVKPYGKR